jgi:hypothetical protein
MAVKKLIAVTLQAAFIGRIHTVSKARCPMDEPLEAQLSAEIERLMAEHRRYSLRLNELLTKPYLSSDEQLEEVRLKKLKLHAKDLMAALEHRVTAMA